nr:MAG TPA: hypothetical protein [Caudoviricetes sp.]
MIFIIFFFYRRFESYCTYSLIKILFNFFFI